VGPETLGHSRDVLIETHRSQSLSKHRKTPNATTKPFPKLFQSPPWGRGFGVVFILQVPVRISFDHKTNFYWEVVVLIGLGLGAEVLWRRGLGDVAPLL
jgi:hypothetical protein